MIKHQKKSYLVEFVTLMTLYVALMAMSIDIVLPSPFVMGEVYLGLIIFAVGNIFSIIPVIAPR